MPHWYLKDYKEDYHKARFEIFDRQSVARTQKAGWVAGFDWTKYLNPQEPSNAYRLMAVGKTRIEGAIAYRDDQGFVFVDLLESAPHNRGFPRSFLNVADVLLGAACQHSFKIGCEGLKERM